MATQVLIVHGQLPFAIKLKQTLERSAPFEAHPFTSVDAAVEYLKDHVQDVALVDFAIPDFPGEQIVRQLRELQPDLIVIATPKIGDDQMQALSVLAWLDRGFNSRDLITVINNHFNRNQRPSYRPAGTTALLARLEKGQRVVPKPPENLPEYTSLDNVLSSAVGTNIFEPPPAEDDTPPSELVWADESSKKETTFDDVLNSLPPDAPEKAARNPFTDLVNSMRSEEEHQPLPSRQQQFVEYILTGGMDSLLDQIEESKNAEDTPKQPMPTTAFERLAQEEPPPPTFEESGTVSDLVVGVHDRSFRNVLSILRGEEVGEENYAEPELPPPSSSDFDVEPRSTPDIPRLSDPFDFDEPTPAKVILQRTLEQQMSGGNFSLEELLASIDAQLPLHRPKILPLPSWLREQQQRSHDDAFLVHEPDFLPEELPPGGTPVEPSEAIFRDQTTRAGRGQVIEAHPEAMETDWLDAPQRSAEETLAFPETLPEEIPADETIRHQPVVEEEGVFAADEWSSDKSYLDETSVSEETPVGHQMDIAQEIAPLADETYVSEEAESYVEEEAYFSDESAGIETTSGWYHLPEQDFNTQFEMMAAFELLGETGAATGAIYAEVPIEVSPIALISTEVKAAPPAEPAPVIDPYLAQLALSLTEVSLELTAEATLLARDQEIVAFAGQMPREEIDELRGVIADDWDAAPGEVRIRFVTAQGSGKDYMLYSRRTEDDFTLSLIFAGTTPLRDIRRQGKRLVNALLAVPEATATQAETQAAVRQAEQADVGTRNPYAFVWLLRDARAHLDSAGAQAIIAGLKIQMGEQHWQIASLQVHEDYVYLLADVPGEDPPYKIIRDLKRRSAEIAHAQNRAYPSDQLWADGYLVVTPGRELDTEEIQQFINFERME